jgi:hypothetical protein
MRADRRAHLIGQFALIAFLVVPIAVGAALGWAAAAAIYLLVIAFAVSVAITVR